MDTFALEMIGIGALIFAAVVMSLTHHHKHKH